MNFVAADGKQIKPLLFRTDLVFSIGLDCVYMKQGLGALLFYNGADFVDRLCCPNFIIYIHNRHQDRVPTQTVPQLF